jgi:hypothetical protein
MTTAELVANANDQNRDEATRSDQAGHAPLYDEREANDLRTRWQNIQGGFVDDPRASVEQADQLVASAIKRLAEIFANERNNLEAAWSKGGEASTEDLRQALRRYRSFFDRLLSV